MKKQSGFLRRLTALALALCMLAALTSEIFAADIVASGYCGGEGDKKNLSWTLDSEGTLTISGNGKMADYNEYSGGPWAGDKVKNVSIENGATSIGAHAFYDCDSLTSITIPNSVTSIGDYAFSWCSSLESAYFRGNAPDIWLNTFSRCKSTFCIYYVPGTSGWTDSSAYNAEKGTWNGYSLKTWNGKTIPEEITVSVPTGKYCIQVIDEFGAPIRDADVTWNDDSGTTNQDGTVFFERFTAGNPVIRVSKAGYTVWTNENSNWKKSEKCFEQVILYPESYGGLKLKAAKIGECDLLTQTKVVNLRNDGALIGDLNSGLFDLFCEATDTSDVAGYLLYQNDKLIAGSLDGKFKDLDVRDFVKGGGCFVRVTSANGQTMDTRINLQFAKNSKNRQL